MFSTTEILGAEIPFYGIMVALGIFACFIMLKLTNKFRDGIDTVEYVYIGLSAGAGAFVMSHIVFAVAQYKKIFYIVTHIEKVFSNFEMFFAYMSDIFGGMVFYGGLIGACIGGYIYMRKNNLDIKEYSDTITPCIPLFHSFGRIGCFLVGCCYGIESNFGIIYHHSIIESANNVRRLPIQLFESAENMIICVILTIMLYKFSNMKHGILIWCYGIIYPVIRFINEFFRGDYSERGYFGFFSTSQWISITVFAVSFFMIIYSIRKKENTIEIKNC